MNEKRKLEIKMIKSSRKNKIMQRIINLAGETNIDPDTFDSRVSPKPRYKYELMNQKIKDLYK
jgi:hypothetical protein